MRARQKKSDQARAEGEALLRRLGVHGYVDVDASVYTVRRISLPFREVKKLLEELGR